MTSYSSVTPPRGSGAADLCHIPVGASPKYKIQKAKSPGRQEVSRGCVEPIFRQ